eukprot:12344332-Alexandrium_andersonii.AAC.1
MPLAIDAQKLRTSSTVGKSKRASGLPPGAGAPCGPSACKTTRHLQNASLSNKSNLANSRCVASGGGAVCSSTLASPTKDAWWCNSRR